MPGDALVDELTLYLEGKTTLDDVRRATRTISSALYTGRLPPRTALVAIDGSLRTAAMRAGIVIDSPEFRAVSSFLSPWLIETCFEFSD